MRRLGWLLLVMMAACGSSGGGDDDLGDDTPDADPNPPPDAAPLADAGPPAASVVNFGEGNHVLNHVAAFVTDVSGTQRLVVVGSDNPALICPDNDAACMSLAVLVPPGTAPGTYVCGTDDVSIEVQKDTNGYTASAEYAGSTCSITLSASGSNPGDAVVVSAVTGSLVVTFGSGPNVNVVNGELHANLGDPP